MNKLNSLAAAACIALSTLSAGAWAQEAPDMVTWSEKDTVEGNLQKRYPNTKFESVKETPMGGVYQVQMGKNVGYVDISGRYFIFGHLFDMQTQTDLTVSPKAEISKAIFDQLPLENAIKVKKGNGKRVFAVFTDPDCPYCKQFESTMLRMDNYTMYIFMMPISSLHPEAHEKAKNIWCTKDKAKAWSDWMLDSIPAAKASGNCKNPIDGNIKLGEQVGAHGTPTLIRADGAITAGALPKPDLEDWLNRGGKQ